MNTALLEFWVKKELVAFQRRESKKLKKGDIRHQILEGMCDCARTPLEQHAAYGQMRYVESTSNWYAFEPGISDMRAFLDIIDRAMPGVLMDKSDKNLHYFRTLAFSLMKEYYDTYPKPREND